VLSYRFYRKSWIELHHVGRVVVPIAMFRNKVLLISPVLMCILLFPFLAVHAAEKLSLDAAERIALKNDAVTIQVQAEQKSLNEQSVAAYSWPDPKINLGVMSLSADSLDFEQEPMTQAVIGLTQAFPPSGGVGAKRDQLQGMAESKGHAANNRQLLTLMGLRKSWLNAYKQHQSLRLINESLEVFKQFISVAQFQYRSGRGNQHDVIRAQLEQSLLMDQYIEMEAMHEAAVAGLKQWLGVQQLHDELDMQFPDIAKPMGRTELIPRLESHPTMLMRKSRITAAESGVKYADAQLNPGWMLNVQYGVRGADRDDLLTAMVSFDLPLFSGKRQDRTLAARKSDLVAVQQDLDNWRRELKARLDKSSAVFERASERVELYHSTVLPHSEQNTEATLNSYQSSVTDFNVLVRARLTELKSQLQFVKLNVERASAQVELLYLAGANQK